MARSQSAPSQTLAAWWRRLRPLPGGTWLFSRLLGWMAPYTGTLGIRVRELGPGHARITLRDRWRVRNHLDSIHAVALANLGEVTSGLALLMALPPGVRGIVTGLTTDYLKKARGPLEATSTSKPPAPVTQAVDHAVEAVIRDQAGDVVARTTVRWRLSPA